MRKYSVCVCMATYNGINYIKSQIDSILPQLSARDEMVISDDGSTDGTLEFLKELEVKYNNVKVVKGPSKGADANFFSLIRRASKDIVFISDQDDIWSNTKIDDVCTVFAENPDALVVLHEDTIRYEKKGIELPCTPLRHGFLINLVKSSYSGHRMAFRKSFCEKIGPVDSRCMSYDQYLGLVAEKNKCTVFLNKKLDVHIMHGRNITRTLPIGQKIKLRWNLIQCMLA